MPVYSRALNSSAQTSVEGEKQQTRSFESVRNSVEEEIKSAAYPMELIVDRKSWQSYGEFRRQALQIGPRVALQRLATRLKKPRLLSPLH